MRPSNGWFTVTATDSQGHVTTVTYEVKTEGIPTTFGLLVWHDDPDGGRFQRGSIALRCTGDGTGVAVNGVENFDVTCAKIL